MDNVELPAFDDRAAPRLATKEESEAHLQRFLASIPEVPEDKPIHDRGVLGYALTEEQHQDIQFLAALNTNNLKNYHSTDDRNSAIQRLTDLYLSLDFDPTLYIHDYDVSDNTGTIVYRAANGTLQFSDLEVPQFLALHKTALNNVKTIIAKLNEQR